jgi:hypothetical protein
MSPNDDTITSRMLSLMGELLHRFPAAGNLVSERPAAIRKASGIGAEGSKAGQAVQVPFRFVWQATGCDGSWRRPPVIRETPPTTPRPANPRDGPPTGEHHGITHQLIVFH